MQVLTNPLGMIAANCYLCIKDGHVLIIDPGDSSRKIKAYLEENNLVVDGILCTHGHYDHIGGVDYFASNFKAPVYISQEDSICFSDPKFNLSNDLIVKSTYQTFKTHNKIGVFDVKAVLASGHSKGSTLLFIDNYLFSGDVLFKNSIGRTDLIGGSDNQMMQSLSYLKTLNPDLEVYPGHGEQTTLIAELKDNPYLS